MNILEKKLNSVRAKGEGILSVSVAPNGIRNYEKVFHDAEYLIASGMDQLMVISYIPEVMKLSSLAPAEQQEVLLGKRDGCYTDVCFDTIKALHERFPDLPLIPTPMVGDMIAYGCQRFVDKAHECGVIGWDTANYMAIPDPLGIRRMIQEKGIGFICAVWCNFIDINNPEHRKMIRETVIAGSGELFVVPAKPGASSALDGRYFKPVVDYIREVQDEIGHRYPLIGISGINTPEDAYQMVKVAGMDGIHLSSAFMKRDLAGRPEEETKAWLQEMKAAMRS